MTNTIGIKPAEPSGQALGWLIQNQQLDDAGLCAALLQSEVEGLERLVGALQRSPAERLRVVDATLLWALHNRRSYQGQQTGRAWLYAAALRACLGASSRWRFKSQPVSLLRRAQAAFRSPLDSASHDGQLFAEQGEEDAFLAFLVYALDLTPEEIGELFQMPLDAVKTRLDAVRAGLAAHRDRCPACKAGFERTAALEAALRMRIRAESGSGYSPAALDAWRFSLLEHLGREQRTRHIRRTIFQSAQAFVFLVVTLIGILVAANAWPPAFLRPVTFSAPKPTAVESLALKASGPSALSTHIPPPFLTPTPGPDPAIYSHDVGLMLVLASTNDQLWHTLWADVSVIQYETVGIDTLPLQQVRKQIWIDQPSSASRVVMGPLNGLPLATYTVLDHTVKGVNFSNGTSFTNSVSGLVLDADLRRLFKPGEIYLGLKDFQSAGKDEIIAGRSAAVLDWMSGGKRIYRYWIDRRYGVILRRAEYGPQDQLLSDLRVNAIYFDADMPGTIFQSSQYRGDHFVRDLFGVPEVPDYGKLLAAWPARPVGLHGEVQNPPDMGGFQGQLAFSSPQARATVDLYAGPYHLGQVPLGGSQILACQRSPDSSQIAYSSLPQDATGNTTLYVANLAELQAAHAVLPGGITAGDFAFSPDSRRIAFFGCEKSTNFCGLFILDLATGNLQRTVAMIYADHIQWSPDSSSVALLAGVDGYLNIQRNSGKNLLVNQVLSMSQSWHFMVISVSSGDVTFRRVYDWAQPGPPADSPSNVWGVPFRVQSAGPDGCVQPQGS